MRKIVFLLVLIVICTFAACTDQPESNITNETTVADTAEITETPQAAYNYPEADYGGYELRVLNITNLWDMYVYLDRAELDGEVLNDAVYTRNRNLEQSLNFTLNEITFESDAGVSQVVDAAKKSLTAGDNAYDIIYLPVTDAPVLMLEGYFYNLKNIGEMQLDQPWWDQQVISAATLNNNLYFTTSPWHLMSFDGTWGLFFNEDIITDYTLEMPYDHVRDNTWTIDTLAEYAKAVTSLNGDESYAWSNDGNAMYGISAHSHVIQKYIMAAGEKFVDINSSGYPEFLADNERFYSVISKLSAFLKKGDGYVMQGSDSDYDVNNGGYMHVFSTERALFLTAEIKAAQLLRDMDFTFGIVPFPKYDSAQESYYSATVSRLFVLTIPVTNPDPTIAATIADVMSYESYSNILPIYFDITVSQKGLRNDDSIEMLNIIRDTRGFDIGEVFTWTSALSTKIATKVFAGDEAVVSDIAAALPTINASIEKMITQLDALN